VSLSPHLTFPLLCFSLPISDRSLRPLFCSVQVDLLHHYGDLPFNLDFYTEMPSLFPLTRYIDSDRQRQTETGQENRSEEEEQEEDEEEEQERGARSAQKGEPLSPPALTFPQ
jgi:hypothetical protein